MTHIYRGADDLDEVKQFIDKIAREFDIISFQVIPIQKVNDRGYDIRGSFTYDVIVVTR